MKETMLEKEYAGFLEAYDAFCQEFWEVEDTEQYWVSLVEEAGVIQKRYSGEYACCLLYTSRIAELLEYSPFSEEREAIVKNEVVELENENMGIQSVTSRIGMVLIVLLADLVIVGCVLFLSAMLIVSQVLFILYVSFLPVVFVLSMFPNSGGQLLSLIHI